MAIGIAPLVLLGVLAGLGHWCMTHAYLLAPASLLTPFTYLQILWATAFGYLMFGQHPDRAVRARDGDRRRERRRARDVGAPAHAPAVITIQHLRGAIGAWPGLYVPCNLGRGYNDRLRNVHC